MNRRSNVITVENIRPDTSHNIQDVRRLVLQRGKVEFETSFDDSVGQVERLVLAGLSVPDFHGIERLGPIVSLAIGAARVGSFDGIEGIASTLTDLNICGYGGRADLTRLGCLEALQTLHIERTGHLANIDFIIDLPSLRVLTLWDANVEDGRVARLTTMPELREAWFTGKKHYDASEGEINSILQKRRAIHL